MAIEEAAGAAEIAHPGRVARPVSAAVIEVTVVVAAGSEVVVVVRSGPVVEAGTAVAVGAVGVPVSVDVAVAETRVAMAAPVVAASAASPRRAGRQAAAQTACSLHCAGGLRQMRCLLSRHPGSASTCRRRKPR